jgi:heme/copper-type cytochrome/quinol oxidase subunit 4
LIAQKPKPMKKYLTVLIMTILQAALPIYFIMSDDYESAAIWCIVIALPHFNYIEYDQENNNQCLSI